MNKMKRINLLASENRELCKIDATKAVIKLKKEGESMRDVILIIRKALDLSLSNAENIVLPAYCSTEELNKIRLWNNEVNDILEEMGDIMLDDESGTDSQD